MSASRRTWIAGVAALLLVLVPFGTFVKTNHKDGSFVSINFIRFFLETFPAALAAVALAAGLIYLLTARRAPQALSRALLAAGGAFFLLFFYHHPFLALFPASLAAWIPAALYLLLVALLAALAFLLAKHAAVLIAVLFFAAANLALTLPAVVKTGVEAARMASFRNAEFAAPAAAAAGARPNIYYVILDAYGSAAALREHLGYDNTPFIQAMEARGFYHAGDALSSYNRTLFTLASIFAQDYFVTDGMTVDTGKQRKVTYPQLLNAPAPPPLIADARRLGYAFYLVGNYWAPCAGPWVSCYAEAAGTAYLSDVFWSATPGAVVSAAARTGAAGDAPDVDAIAKLRKHLKEAGAPKVPTFTFVHHLSPHAPYLFRADCSQRDNYDLELDGWPDAAKPYFLDNLKCANLNAARIADEIAALDPGAIIVFQGDHGTSFTVDWEQPFDAWQPGWVRERSSILNLIKLPEACRAWLAPNLDNVSTIRAVMGCVAGRAPDGERPRGYVNTFSEENPDHGQVRQIDPASFRLLPAGGG
ncbi:MAG: hypothetical protein Kow00114_32040 [Kiloniellaceae bacterium]